MPPPAALLLAATFGSAPARLSLSRLAPRPPSLPLRRAPARRIHAATAVGGEFGGLGRRREFIGRLRNVLPGGRWWRLEDEEDGAGGRADTAPPSAQLGDAASAEAATPPASVGGSGGSFRWLGLRKRRRRGGVSRSVSGRSSDRRRSGTCSDFHVTCGPGGGGATDSSGEMWASDVGELRARDVPMAPEFASPPVGGAGSGAGGMAAGVETAATDSGYGSEPGYRGDVELGYGDEIDEEEEDGRQQVFFWGGEIGGDGRA